LSNRNYDSELHRALDVVIGEWAKTIIDAMIDRWEKDGVVHDELSAKWRIQREFDEAMQELDSELYDRINILIGTAEDDAEKNEH